jgi:hypothetical protein
MSKIESSVDNQAESWVEPNVRSSLESTSREEASFRTASSAYSSDADKIGNSINNMEENDPERASAMSAKQVRDQQSCLTKEHADELHNDSSDSGGGSEKAPLNLNFTR